MKKLFLFAIAGIMTVVVSAQEVKTIDFKGDFRSDFGIGTGITLGLVDPIDFTPSFNYYFGDNSNYWTIDCDFHYNFKVNAVELYPIAGICFFHGKNNTNIGADLGGGIAYRLNSEWTLKGELKYQSVKHWDDLYISIGLSYNL